MVFGGTERVTAVPLVADVEVEVRPKLKMELKLELSAVSRYANARK